MSPLKKILQTKSAEAALVGTLALEECNRFEHRWLGLLNVTMHLLKLFAKDAMVTFVCIVFLYLVVPLDSGTKFVHKHDKFSKIVSFGLRYWSSRNTEFLGSTMV